MSASKLVKPDVIYRDSFLEGLAEFQEEGRYHFLNLNEIKTNFDSFVDDINNRKLVMHPQYESWVEVVPETVLWLVKGHDYIGSVNIRHRLNWHLEKWGGNVNFLIRPSMRGKGFGKKALQKAMPVIAYLGVDRALITLKPDDKAAMRIVEFCGGEFDDETPKTEKFPARKRYWLDCT